RRVGGTTGTKRVPGVTKAPPSPVDRPGSVRYGAAHAGPLRPGRRGPACPQTAAADSATLPAARRSRRRRGRPARNAARDRVRPERSGDRAADASSAREPAPAGGPADTDDGRVTRRVANPAPHLAEPRHRDRLPLDERRRPRAFAARTPGKSRRARTTRAQDLRRRPRALRLLPAEWWR